MKRRPGTRSKMACVLACAAWALCMQGAEAETATWITSQKGTVSWETAAYWEAGVVPAITNSLDLSATNLVVTLAGDPPGLQVIDNPWTQEDGGDKVVLALNALVGGPKTEFDKFGQGLSKMQQRLRQTDEELDNLIGVRSRAISRKLRAVQTMDEGTAAALLELDNEPGRPVTARLPENGEEL